MKPPVPWVGGKSSIADEILRRFPLKYSRFVEVFGGGGALTFHKTPDPDELYNDLDGRLFNLFRCIRDRPMALLKELGFLPLCGRDEFFCLQRFLDKREFDDAFMQEELDLAGHCLDPPDAAEIRELLQRRGSDRDFRMAAIFFRMMRYSFGAGGKSYGCKGVDIRRFFYLIQQAALRLGSVNIENQHFKTLIPHYDGKGVLLYLDPPYWGAEDYDVPFTMRDHLDLRNLLREIEGFFILSYSDHLCVRYLYKDKAFRIVELQRHDSLSMMKGKVYNELLIFNYDPGERERQAPAQISLF